MRQPGRERQCMKSNHVRSLLMTSCFDAISTGAPSAIVSEVRESSLLPGCLPAADQKRCAHLPAVWDTISYRLRDIQHHLAPKAAEFHCTAGVAPPPQGDADISHVETNHYGKREALFVHDHWSDLRRRGLGRTSHSFRLGRVAHAPAHLRCD